MSEPWTLIKIDEQNRPLRFTAGTLRDFETIYARSIGQPDYPFGRLFLRLYSAETRFETMANYNLLAHLLWAGLRWRWATLTVEKVIGLIDGFEDDGGDMLADLWGPLELALGQTAIFKSMLKQAEVDKKAGAVPNEPTGLDPERTESPSKTTDSDTGTRTPSS